MSKTLTSEEYYEKWMYNNQDTFVSTKIKDLLPMFAQEYANYLHKAKVLSITDKIKIEVDKIQNQDWDLGFKNGYYECFNDLEKLLEQ